MLIGQYKYFVINIPTFPQNKLKLNYLQNIIKGFYGIAICHWWKCIALA